MSEKEWEDLTVEEARAENLANGIDTSDLQKWAVNKLKEVKLRAKVKLIKDGFAGVNKDGVIVDIRSENHVTKVEQRNGS